MTFLENNSILEVEHPSAEEIANLAFKFYLDSNCEPGHDHENWLCAEYMLEQKKLIERQIEEIHHREHSYAGE